MLFQINPLSPEPLYDQVVYQVKAAVARGELRAGDRLPSVRELARQLTINPNTVARSYQALEGDGVIVRRQGAGCFVTGGPSNLREEERARRLEEHLARLVTEAYHLGFGADEVRAALERRLAQVEFPPRPETETAP